MEKVDVLSYILIALVFLFSFSANLSTEHVRRRQLYIVASMPALFFFLISVLYHSPSGSTEAQNTAYILFAGIGLVLPQPISRMFVRQKIKHPVTFMPKKKIPPILIIPGVLLVFMAWLAFLPREYSSTTGSLVYDEFQVLQNFGYLVFFISLIVFSLQTWLERDAICENGFCQGGLLSDWSNFKSYSWSQDKMYSDPSIQPLLDQSTLIELIIEPKNTFFTKQIQLAIPFSEKNAVENLLSKKLMAEQR